MAETSGTRKCPVIFDWLVGLIGQRLPVEIEWRNERIWREREERHKDTQRYHISRGDVTYAEKSEREWEESSTGEEKRWRIEEKKRRKEEGNNIKKEGRRDRHSWQMPIESHKRHRLGTGTCDCNEPINNWNGDMTGHEFSSNAYPLGETSRERERRKVRASMCTCCGQDAEEENKKKLRKKRTGRANKSEWEKRRENRRHAERSVVMEVIEGKMLVRRRGKTGNKTKPSS